MQTTALISHIRQGKNPRTYFDSDEMAELEEGMRLYGVLQAILVRPIEGTGDFEIIAGERRWRAAKNVFGDDYEMPITIKAIDDAEAEAIALIENIQRANLSAAEEAKAAKRLLYRNRNDKEETARQLGWSIGTIENRLALTACTESVLKALTERKILIGHAELLAGVPPSTQDTVLKGIIEHKVPVVVLKAQLGKFARKLSDAIFNTSQCSNCPHNSAMQAGLFGESLGEGYCQHPTHFDELTTQSVEAKAATLKEEYPVIRIVKLQDGFEPLPVTTGGELGVGTEQYASCKGCQHFGCAVSNMPGSYGEVTPSLCFDAACHTQKVAAHRKAERTKNNAAANESGIVTASGKSTNTLTQMAENIKREKPSNQTPQRVMQYRVEQWRKWVANALMAQSERNKRVLIALTLAGHGNTLSESHYGEAAGKITQGATVAGGPFKTVLENVDACDAMHTETLMKAITASAAFGIDQVNLEVLLNYLQIDERKCFRLSQSFLELFTKSELDSIADELKLKKALGAQFKKLREGKREDFIKGLLSIKGFEYTGLVPDVMRYPRKKFKYAAPVCRTGGEEGGTSLPDAQQAAQEKEQEALVA